MYLYYISPPVLGEVWSNGYLGSRSYLLLSLVTSTDKYVKCVCVNTLHLDH